MLTGRVLVTGATGALGSNVVSRLVKDGVDCAVLKLHVEPLGDIDGREVDVRLGDVRDAHSLRDAFVDVDTVLHLAGIAVPLDRLERDMWEVNVVGTLNAATAARDAGVRRFVHVSSTAAIGYPPDGVVADEQFALSDSVTDNAYARTKRNAESLLRRYQKPGFDVVTVNPAAVVGPGGSRVYGWGGLIGEIASGRLPFVPPGGSAFCAIDDLVDGLFLAAAKGVSGERYIISTANLSYLEAATLVADIAGVAPPRRVAPSWVLRAVAAANALWPRRGVPHNSAALLVPENVELMNRRLYYSAQRATRELGFVPTTLRPAIKETLRWCRASSTTA